MLKRSWCCAVSKHPSAHLIELKCSSTKSSNFSSRWIHRLFLIRIWMMMPRKVNQRRRIQDLQRCAARSLHDREGQGQRRLTCFREELRDEAILEAVLNIEFRINHSATAPKCRSGASSKIVCTIRLHLITIYIACGIVRR